MKKFTGLLQKEWTLYKTWLFIAIIAGLTILLVIPFSLEQYAKGNNLKLPEIRPFLAFVVLMLGSLYSTLQFLASIRYDLKSNEIWLHSTCSIGQLIGAKIVFILAGYTIFNTFFTTLGLIVSRQFIEANLGQYLLFLFIVIVIVVLIQLSLLITALFFLAVYLQAKRYIGRLAIIVSTVGFFISMYFSFRIIESPYYKKLLHHGEIDINKLAPFLPHFSDPSITTELGSIYIVDQLASLLVSLLLYIIATKWIEKVVMK